MNLQPKANPENEALKRAFIATSVALYLQACHLQYEEETESVMLSFLIANAASGKSGTTPIDQSGTGKAGQGNSGNSGDDEDGPDETNLGSSLVNNTGQVTSDADFAGADSSDVPRKDNDSSRQASEEAENAAATSPGGTGDSRIIGGVNPENDEIDWNDAVDDGTKDADAATG